MSTAAAALLHKKLREKNVRKRLERHDFSHDEDRDEFIYIDYTPAINPRPIDFPELLRVSRFRRRTRIFVCVTMYNEERVFLERSLMGIAENLEGLFMAGVPWEEVLVCVICDGRSKLHPDTAKYLEDDVKVYDSSLINVKHLNYDVTMHLFEKSVELSKHYSTREYYYPMQLIFALKEKNGGKLNSHLWFFTAFCNQVNPDFVFLVDVGTRPRRDSIVKLYKAMHVNPQLGGVCGEIAVAEPKYFSLIESAQHFEYKTSHVMDKSMESIFGYIAVLPGAFSAYRWEAVQGEPLSKYFFVEEHTLKEMGPFMANMYLAEDRVLSFEIAGKEDAAWTLHYVAGAVADTDVPSTLAELMKQRRRWLNGSFFALVYYVTKFHKIYRTSGHSLTRKMWFVLQFVHQTLFLALNWFMLGGLYLSLGFVYRLALLFLGPFAQPLIFTFNLIYSLFSVGQLIIGLGGNVGDAGFMYTMISFAYSLIMIVALVLSVFLVSQQAISFEVVYAALGLYAMYFIAGIFHGEFFSILVSALQYYLMIPTFAQLLPIYSFCNMHDISWGTKEGNYQNSTLQQQPKEQKVKDMKSLLGAVMGDKLASTAGATTTKEVLLALARKEKEMQKEQRIAKKREEAKKDEAYVASLFRTFRMRMLVAWFSSNWTLVMFIAWFDYWLEFVQILAATVSVSIAYRFCGSMFYILERYIRKLGETLCCCCCYEGRACRRPRAADDEDREDDDEESGAVRDRSILAKQDRHQTSSLKGILKKDLSAADINGRVAPEPVESKMAPVPAPATAVAPPVAGPLAAFVAAEVGTVRFVDVPATPTHDKVTARSHTRKDATPASASAGGRGWARLRAGGGGGGGGGGGASGSVSPATPGCLSPVRSGVSDIQSPPEDRGRDPRYRDSDRRDRDGKGTPDARSRDVWRDRDRERGRDWSAGRERDRDRLRDREGQHEARGGSRERRTGMEDVRSGGRDDTGRRRHDSLASDAAPAEMLALADAGSGQSAEVEKSQGVIDFGALIDEGEAIASKR